VSDSADASTTVGVDLEPDEPEPARPRRSTGTKMFIVGPSRFGEPRQLQIAERLFGRPPDRVEGGVSVWMVP
jgi:hypothetical protein